MTKNTTSFYNNRIEKVSEPETIFPQWKNLNENIDVGTGTTNNLAKNKKESTIAAEEIQEKFLREDIIEQLDLKAHKIKKEDFDIKQRNWTTIINWRSSYFCSLIWINWKHEKESIKTEDKKKYDALDQEFNNIINDEQKYKNFLAKYSNKKDLLDYIENTKHVSIDIFLNGGCVISWKDSSFIWIKKTPLVAFMEKLRNIDIEDPLYMNDTISHEQQHIKFSSFLKSNWIKNNKELRLLDEILAHCINTIDEKWNVNFKKIKESILGNQNYLSTFLQRWWIASKFAEETTKVIDYVENELNGIEWNNIQEKIKNISHKLINKYKTS